MLENVTTIMFTIQKIDEMTKKSLKFSENSLSIDNFIKEKRDNAANYKMFLFTNERLKFLKIHEHMNNYTAIKFDYETTCFEFE